MTEPEGTATRQAEWFVPSWGPVRLRTFIGLLFLPYTAMVLSFAVIGSMLAPRVSYERVAAIVVIYFLGLGIAAHALDALGSRALKPWGSVFSRRELWGLALSSLAVAYGVALYYMRVVPLLSLVAVAEGFFVFAYNLEWFGGRFHTDRWFALSWGALPVLAGCLMQTNAVSLPALLAACATALMSLVEIKASRPYKVLRRARWPEGSAEQAALCAYESILKSISAATICLAAALFLWRFHG